MNGSGQVTASALAVSRATETVPIEHETRERLVRVGVIGLPVAALGVAAWLAWGGALRWHDLVVLAIVYALTGAGITVGYHRLFTHRSFKTTRGLRALFAVLGSMAVEGPVIEWVSTHRKHHAFSDRRGDPHSPHADQAPGWRGALRGLVHAHVGWMFRGQDMANPAATRRTCSPTSTCG
jgi:stearoyl-CoA desaturase (Delta-9 desaturase)